MTQKVVLAFIKKMANEEINRMLLGERPIDLTKKEWLELQLDLKNELVRRTK